METYHDVKIKLSVPDPLQEPDAFSISRSSSSLQVELNILRQEENMWVKVFPGGTASIEDIRVVEDLRIKIAPFDYQTLLMSMSGNDHHNIIFRQWFSYQVLFPMGVQPGLHDDIIREVVEFVGGIQDSVSRLPPGTVFPLRLTLTARFFHVPSDHEVADEKGMMTPATVESIRALKRVTTLEDDGKCVICLEELVVDGSEATVMPCSHLFHGSCITAWLEQSHLCPLCRFQMPSSSSSSSSSSIH